MLNHLHHPEEHRLELSFQDCPCGATIHTHSLILIGPIRTLEDSLRLARRSCHPLRSEADAAAAHHVCHSSLFLSFSTVLLHISLGQPRFLLPSGAQINAVLKRLSGLFLNTCRNHRHLLTHIRTDTSVLPVASYSSSLLKWLGQNLLSTLLRQVR